MGMLQFPVPCSCLRDLLVLRAAWGCVKYSMCVLNSYVQLNEPSVQSLHPPCQLIDRKPQKSVNAPLDSTPPGCAAGIARLSRWRQRPPSAASAAGRRRRCRPRRRPSADRRGRRLAVVFVTRRRRRSFGGRRGVSSRGVVAIRRPITARTTPLTTTISSSSTRRPPPPTARTPGRGGRPLLSRGGARRR